MRDHPKLFTAPMVRALLREENPKTVTRRLVSPQTARFGSASKLFWEHADLDRAWVDGTGSPEEYLHVPCHRGDERELARLDAHWKAKGQENTYREQFPDCGPCEVCDQWGWRMTSHRLWPRIKPGDRIWVRETFTLESCSETGWYEPPHNDGRPLKVERDTDGSSWWVQPHYRATDPEPELSIPGSNDPGCLWKPSIHMPRWASRLTLEVVSVRVERLQDITEEDASREGVERRHNIFHPEIQSSIENPCTRAFAVLWDEIYGKVAPWRSNPMVWRYELRRVETP